MEDSNLKKIMSFKVVSDKTDITFNGFGKFNIGLSINGSLSVGREEDGEEDDLCMTLLQLNVHDNGGYTLTAVNKDLKCIVNSTEELSGEINLVDGTRLEVADKTLVFVDGPIPKRRRKLPPTPGMALVDAPPNKPTRAGQTQSPDHKQSTEDANEESGIDNDDTDKRWLENSWCMLDLPVSNQEKLHGLETPEQISILAASYFTKQLRMFTDASVTANHLDEIFKLFMDTVYHCKNTYMNYLSDVSKALAKTPDSSQNRPMHGPAIILLTELLKHCFDPVSRVTLILDLIRTFSHFDRNLVTMVRCQTTAAVLGSMSVYLDKADVQQYAMDILTKVATFTPALDIKAPLREAGIDLVIRGAKYHTKHLAILRSACRVLANISTTLVSVLNNWLDLETSDTSVVEAVEKYESLLTYIFEEGIPVVQAVLKDFGTDLGVRTEGRRFIYYYAKLPQLQLKKSKLFIPNDDTHKEEHIDNSKQEDCQTESLNQHARSSSESRSTSESPEPASFSESRSTSASPKLVSVATHKDDDTPGILKKSRSYECLKTSERRLNFADGVVGGSDSDSSTSESEEQQFKPSFEEHFPASINMTDDFSSNVVDHLMKKTLKRRQHIVTESMTEGAYSESDSDNEFHESITTKPTHSVAVDSEMEEHNDDQHTKKDEFNEKDHIEIQGNENSVTTEFETEDDRRTVNNGYVQRTDELKDYDKLDITNHTDKSISSPEEPVDRVDTTTIDETDSETNAGKPTETDPCITDVYFFGKLVRTQIIVYVGSLVFQGEDSKVLLVIDQPLKSLLEDATAPPGLIEFAGLQYGANMTLMDLDPAIIISIIDAVRYRSVTKDLVQSSVLSQTRSINATLQQSTITTTMLLYKAVFADKHLHTIVTDEDFLKEFRTCFHMATENLKKSHSIEEIRIQSQSFVV